MKKQMMGNRTKKSIVALVVVVGSGVMFPHNYSVIQSASAQLEEIVVTARKREESVMEVPVAITALSAQTLERGAISSIDGIAQRVPSLLIGEGSGTVQGGNIALRGIGSAGSNPNGDQAVSFNIDGVQVAKSSVRRMGQFDLAQIEVLRGPQALFFGKNSPGGVISMHTANPTDEFTAKISVGYETEADEIRTEGFISGPISDTVGYRIAGYYSDMDGWLDSVIPAASPFQGDDTLPQTKEYAVRTTLTFEPNDKFDATLKLTANSVESPGINSTVQYVHCPFGVPQLEIAAGLTPADDCKPGNETIVANYGPGFDFTDSAFASGKTYLEQDQFLVGLEMNYQINDQLSLTSVTGVYDMELDNIANFTNSYSNLLPSHNLLDISEFSQELRLTSDYDGRFNFTVGTHLSTSSTKGGSHTYLVVAPQLGIELNEYFTDVDTTAWSVFAQVSYELSDQLELTFGGRYSDEKKELKTLLNDSVDTLTGTTALFAGIGVPTYFTAPIQLTPETDEVSFDDFSPEVTLAWQPNDNINLYASYKEGFLSGGFNGSSGITITSVSPLYEPQETKGFEVGLKGDFLDGRLRAGIAAYSYEVTGLQVVVVIDSVIQTLQNVGEMTTQGVEFDFEWATPVDGLTVHGALAYNDAEYDDYQANCYRGQHAGSPVPCLNQTNRFTGQTGLYQDLSGTQAVRAPDYSGNLGFNFDTSLNSRLNFGFSSDITFSDGFIAAVSSKPTGNSPSYAIVNASVRLSDVDDRWEVALIGSNLTEEYYWVQHTDVPFTGSAPTGVTPTGAEFFGDTVAGVNRGRQVMVRFTYHFGG